MQQIDLKRVLALFGVLELVAQLAADVEVRPRFEPKRLDAIELEQRQEQLSFCDVVVDTRDEPRSFLHACLTSTSAEKGSPRGADSHDRNSTTIKRLRKTCGWRTCRSLASPRRRPTNPIPA
jgi:hypothetical protein